MFGLAIAIVIGVTQCNQHSSVKNRKKQERESVESFFKEMDNDDHYVKL